MAFADWQALDIEISHVDEEIAAYMRLMAVSRAMDQGRPDRFVRYLQEALERRVQFVKHAIRQLD